MKIKPVQIGWMLKCSVAGKHIEQEYKELFEALYKVKQLEHEGETFVGQITIIPILRYIEIIQQR